MHTCMIKTKRNCWAEGWVGLLTLFLNVTRDKEKEWFVGRVGHYHDFFPGVINNKSRKCPFQQDTLLSVPTQ